MICATYRRFVKTTQGLKLKNQHSPDAHTIVLLTL